jgi:hypothetical protein
MTERQDTSGIQKAKFPKGKKLEAHDAYIGKCIEFMSTSTKTAYGTIVQELGERFYDRFEAEGKRVFIFGVVPIGAYTQGDLFLCPMCEDTAYFSDMAKHIESKKHQMFIDRYAEVKIDKIEAKLTARQQEEKDRQDRINARMRAMKARPKSQEEIDKQAEMDRKYAEKEAIQEIKQVEKEADKLAEVPEKIKPVKPKRKPPPRPPVKTQTQEVKTSFAPVIPKKPSADSVAKLIDLVNKKKEAGEKLNTQDVKAIIASTSKVSRTVKRAPKASVVQIEEHKAPSRQVVDIGEGRVICECGTEVRRDGLARHRKTAKHMKLMLL